MLILILFSLGYIVESLFDGEVIISSGNGLVWLGTKPLPESMLSKIMVLVGIMRSQGVNFFFHIVEIRNCNYVNEYHLCKLFYN